MTRENGSGGGVNDGCNGSVVRSGGSYEEDYDGRRGVCGNRKAGSKRTEQSMAANDT